jgi:hypothetical protein
MYWNILVLTFNLLVLLMKEANRNTETRKINFTIPVSTKAGKARKTEPTLHFIHKLTTHWPEYGCFRCWYHNICIFPIKITLLDASYSVLSNFSFETIKFNLIPLHSTRSQTTIWWSLVPIFFRSSSTSSVHLFHGLPLVLIVPFWQSLFVPTFLRYLLFLSHAILM